MSESWTPSNSEAVWTLLVVAQRYEELSGLLRLFFLVRCRPELGLHVLKNLLDQDVGRLKSLRNIYVVPDLDKTPGVQSYPDEVHEILAGGECKSGVLLRPRQRAKAKNILTFGERILVQEDDIDKLPALDDALQRHVCANLDV
ncbi:hypothetical protein DOTSEDRAFT_33613 [Dothistroma septosporum NZE10]|uniref:Uncharacterized protein n=1 Tax=Dothistroma septosporum (strain NZE10 / CBS 128990) TaxID=675120 RepID=N1PNM7_DOTSN|nr:hypothetical protein DOTSEDRAFT_33613 [Dothistroma septosporum NZE10]